MSRGYRGHQIDPRRSAACLLGLCCALVLGCGTRQAKYEVCGAVSLDGVPLEEGDLLFIATDNSSSEGSKIDAGRYRLAAAAGRYKVLITASVRAKLPVPSPEPREVWYHQSIIPVCYNDQSTLTAAVAPDNENRYDFKLASYPQ